MRAKDLSGLGMRLCNDLLDLLVNETSGLLAVFLGCVSGNRQEERGPRPLERNEAQLLAHAELGNHGPGYLCGPLKIVLRAARDIPEDHLFGDPATQKDRDSAEQLRAGHEITL